MVKAGEDYLDELIAEVGEPTPEERVRGEAIARKLAREAESEVG
ncbi:MAG: hypothetical protein ACR2K6_09340 [Solirubrobacterales bacterium]